MNVEFSGTPERQAIIHEVEALRPDAVSMLCDLVRYPSLLGDEGPAQSYMADRLRGMGLQVHEFEIDEEKIKTHPGYSPSLVSYAGRGNVVGIHRPAGPVGGKSLILNGHIDVVPIGAETLWSHPPFQPAIEGDRVYGRGAGDMKAGIVAYTMAFRALQRMGWEPAAPVYLQSVIEEECTGNGALACLVEGYTADAALIPEPVDGILTSQMGVMWLALEVLGVPVHAAVAHTGAGAIEFTQYLVSKLMELERRWNELPARHPHYRGHDHPVNFNLGKISGGEWASSVSTQCRADIRLGFYPGIKPSEVRREIEALLKAAHDAHPDRGSVRYQIVYKGFQAEGFLVDMGQPMIATLTQSHRDIAGADAVLRASTATTDARFFHLYGGIPATCYGPIEGNGHGIDEWVSIDSMQQVAAVLALFIARWCGLNRV